ncbi:hypothetical protein AOQ84DRAFT_69825 [Glonium stellatum]|uniref:U3 small nucleolar RNA-associated protein 10 n=1 Tax=Glonium stellatum TaxID=574774 RepID=A0A8E2JRK2_9PEZI|nr:hypothetical protein AOQ84DRAFT_69825 [Glonium stellatum]
MTSLQKQLAAIAASSTHQLDLKAQKAAHGKSLLFESKIAASQNFNSIYQICYEGFQELCALDSRFVAFSRNLFSEQSKSEERTQMTAKENQELDSVIESFLSLVGPRLLLKPAVKAVEWLIRRFRIHEYNTEFLILTFLPYHSNLIFPTMLSILPAKMSPTFRFLHPYISSLANPPRQTIVYTATNTPAFFSALEQYVLKVLRAGHQSSSLLSFWASVTTQAVDGMLDSARSGRRGIQQQREEELLLRILPVLNECLTFVDAPEAILGCYMITTVLVTKSNLEDKVLNALMEAIAASLSRETTDGCLVCLAVIAEERKGAKLPKSAAKRIMKLDGLADKIVSLAQDCRIERLALGCALAAIERLETLYQSQDIALIDKILESDILDDPQTSVVIKSLLLLIEHMDGASVAGSEIRNQLSGLIVRLNESPTIGGKLQRVIQEHDIDVDTLEMRLNATLRPTNAAALPSIGGEQDEEMVDVEISSTPSLDVILSVLPTHIDEPSFLTAPKPPIFEELAQAFTKIVSLNANPDRFASLEVFGKGDASDNILLLSFLTRVWNGTFPVLVRSAALQLAAKYLRSSKTTGDLQALFPYAISALSDPSVTVRRSAAEFILALKQSFATTDKTPKDKVWDVSSLYGQETSRIHWLSADEGAKLLSSILMPTLEECVLDADHITQVVQTSLDGPARSKLLKAAHAELKSSHRTSIVSFLSSHAVITPLLSVRLRLLSILSLVGKIASGSRINVLLPALRHWCSLPEADVITRCTAENIDIAKSDKQHLALISGRDSEGIDLLKGIIAGDVGPGRLEIQKAAFEQLRAIWSSIKAEMPQSVAALLLDLALTETDSVDALEQSRQADALETLRTVKLPTFVLESFIESIPNAIHMPDKPPASKRRRTSRSEMARVEFQDPKDIAIALRRLTLVLELVEISNPEDHPELMRGLFHILDELQQFKMQSGSSLVYLQSLVIGSLLSIIDKLKETKEPNADTSAIRADLLVDCIRHTTNPQVQNAALLLISSLASWMPELVLHNLMPIFTFMGSTLLRQSDDYSAHVIDQTITRVVPQLADSLRKRNKDFIIGMADLLLSFTAAFEHIPLHRRLGLFGQLAKTLGPEDSLFAIISLLVDRYPSVTGVQQFVSDLLGMFDPMVAVQASKRYLDLIDDSLRPKRTVSDVLFGLNEKDANQVESSLLNLLSSLAEILDGQRLHARLSRVLRHDSEAEKLRVAFTEAMEKTIQISQQVKGREVLYNACSRVLSSLLNLLPTVDLIKSAEILLDNPNDEVRRTALKSVEVKVQSIRQGDDISTKAILAFLSRIGTIIQHSPDVALKHTAVACIDQISERFGKKDPSAIAAAAQIVSGVQSLGSGDDRLRIISLLCLASTVDVIQDEFIPLLPTVLPKAFTYLMQSLDSRAPKKNLHNAVYALLCSVVERLPFMFSGQYLDGALELSYRSAVADLDSDLDESRNQFFQLAAKQIDAKECFSAIEGAWPGAVSMGYQAIHELVKMLDLAISSRAKSAILKNTQVLYSIFLEAFDLRRKCATGDLEGKYGDSELEQLESLVNEAAISMTLKLNDATFRPFFARLVEWASKSLPKRDSEGKMLRSTTLYLFLGTFFDRLKSIVTSYSSYILEHAAEILDNVSPTDEQGLKLSKAVLHALSKSFEHDQDDFWQAPSHFSAISGPLLKQLTNPSSVAIAEDIIPAITELAASAGSADHRLAAVKCEQSLTERLGEEWLGLLAEMLPFISELQEDDDEVVERETQRWISMIEEILGESLDPMLQ